MQAMCPDGKVRKAEVKATGGFMPDASVRIKGRRVQGFLNGWHDQSQGIAEFVPYSPREVKA